jgi:WD40 repeat protein
MHNHRVKSQIGLVGGSNKELIVYDANYNKPIAILNDGHYKHIHTVKFYEGSYRDAEAYNTFLTASTDNFIKLWDLRVGQPVREFGRHQNRAI